MMRYRILVIVIVIMTFPSLEVRACEEPSLVKSILKSTKTSDINDLLKQDLSIINNDDIQRVEDYLADKQFIEKREWRKKHADEIACCDGCLGLTPIVIGMCFDGCKTVAAPSLERLPIGAGVGLFTSVIAMTAFSHWYQAPETETSRQLALVLQESKRRKEKID